MDALDFFVPDKREGREEDTGGSDHREESAGVAEVATVNHLLVDSVTHLTMLDGQIPHNIITENSTDENEDASGDRLTLAYERLFEIPKTIVDRFAAHIKYLDIGHNKITNLDTLVFFKELTSLIADDNPINEDCFLPPLPNLQLLWLNHCKISSLFPWIHKLRQSCPNLQYLCLMGNPAAPSYLNGGTFYEYLQYRLFVISQFPSLVHLDDRAVTDDQRSEAQRLYKRPLFERLLNPGAGGISDMVAKSGSWNMFNGFFSKRQSNGNNSRNLLI